MLERVAVGMKERPLRHTGSRPTPNSLPSHSLAVETVARLKDDFVVESFDGEGPDMESERGLEPCRPGVRLCPVHTGAEPVTMEFSAIPPARTLGLGSGTHSPFRSAVATRAMNRRNWRLSG